MTDVSAIRQQFEADLAGKMGAEQAKIKYLGRKQGILTSAFRQVAGLPPQDRQKFGSELNSLKQYIEQRLLSLAGRDGGEAFDFDLTVPAADIPLGHLHPMTITRRGILDIFCSLGFSVESGPEVENDWFNFVALNFPEGHPARDMQDTFYVKGFEQKPAKERLLLRTHTSPVQIRYMQKHKPPFAIVVPGRVYRNEATDATHEHTIEQLEGLVVGEDVSFAQMTWTLDQAFRRYFGPDAKTKLRPSYFPFVEPGAEMSMSSPKFKNGKWVELVGCGMVHQNVFAAAGYPKNKYQGFAFGFGTIRFPLMRYGVPDIRMLHENDLRFLKQF